MGDKESLDTFKPRPDFDGLPENSEDEIYSSKANLNQAEKPPALPREGLSKRFISQKIEEMLQSGVTKNTPKATNDLITEPTHDSKNNNAEFQDEEELLGYSSNTRVDSIKKPPPPTPPLPIVSEDEMGFFRKYYLMIFLLFIIAAGWTWFFINHYGRTSSQAQALILDPISIQIENLLTWKNSAPIIATPLLADANGDNALDVIWGDNLGYLRAIDPRTQELIYESFLGAPVVASLTTVEVNGITPPEILVANEKGSFFTINTQGGYLYRSREEFFNETLYAKPLVLRVEGGEQILFFVGMAGKVWAVDSRYGEVLWVNKSSPAALKNEGFFSSPIFIKHLSTVQAIINPSPGSVDTTPIKSLSSWAEEYSLLVLSEKGTLAALDPATGALRWTKNFSAGFKASPVSIMADGQEGVVLVDITGKIYVLATNPESGARGKVLVEKTVNAGVVSSPVTGLFSTSETREILIATESGKLFLGKFVAGSDSYDFRLDEVYQNRVGDGFLASPVIADFNQNQKADVFIVSRSGKVLLLELLTEPAKPGTESATDTYPRFQELTPPYELLYNVTASPVVADLNSDGQLEAVIAGEDGTVTVLTLRVSPQAVFVPNTTIATQFLYNELNLR